MIQNISTTPYTDQKMGTAGIRKKSKIVTQPNYIENFVQSLFDAIGGVEGQTFVLGGDGRYFNDIAIQKIIKIAAANGMKKLIVGQNGLISTPASSKVLLKNHADGGLVLSASHNPGGENGDFGIKYATKSGGHIKKLFAGGFKFAFDAMNAVTGPYAVKIFEQILGAPKGSVRNFIPKPDFGGLHPDPNLIYAKHLVDEMYSDNGPDFGAANDGDGDRNMILGHKFFVTPSDSLAILTDNYKLIPGYKNGIFGVAKSAATSTAVERVAKALNIGYYEVPTGWKYFCNLMDSNRITFCGEESFGTGSSHIREKDGIWAVLFWLNIIAATGKSVEQITRDFWKKYGRSYYLRFDFEGIDTAVADKLMADLEEKLPSLNGKQFGKYQVADAAPFIYHDPVDGSSTKNGLIIRFTDGSRIVYRLSGTGTSGATLRVYLEAYEQHDFDKDVLTMLRDVADIAMDVAQISQRTGKTQPDVTT